MEGKELTLVVKEYFELISPFWNSIQEMKEELKDVEEEYRQKFAMSIDEWKIFIKNVYLIIRASDIESYRVIVEELLETLGKGGADNE